MKHALHIVWRVVKPLGAVVLALLVLLAVDLDPDAQRQHRLGEEQSEWSGTPGQRDDGADHRQSVAV